MPFTKVSQQAYLWLAGEMVFVCNLVAKYTVDFCIMNGRACLEDSFHNTRNGFLDEHFRRVLPFMSLA